MGPKHEHHSADKKGLVSLGTQVPSGMPEVASSRWGSILGASVSPSL